jgi:hypothetical protein
VKIGHVRVVLSLTSQLASRAAVCRYESMRL